MKRAALLVLPLLIGSTSALATGGITCRPAGGEGPVLSLVVGHVLSGGVVGAALTDDGVTRSTLDEDPAILLAQSWIDREHLWIDIVDAQALAFEARLRARFADGAGPTTAEGTLSRAGRTYRVRCAES